MTSIPSNPAVPQSAPDPGDRGRDDLAASLGVVRHMSETYTVGGYRYTTLTDAIAQGRRMAKLETDLLKQGT